MALAPVPHALGIWVPYIARQPETVILREKVMSLSGDSFDIQLRTGQPILRVQGKVLSISGRKSVYDMGGNHLFDIVKEHLHIHATFKVEARDARTGLMQKVLEVKSSFALLGSKATATFTNAVTGTPETLMMKGNFFDSAADIVDQRTGFVVGRINRKLLNAGELFFGQQTYELMVAPGVDMAMLVAMCICMDEKNNEGKGGFF